MRISGGLQDVSWLSFYFDGGRTQINLHYALCSALVASLDESLVSIALVRDAPVMLMIGQQGNDAHF
jgi:hypothetical protein